MHFFDRLRLHAGTRQRHEKGMEETVCSLAAPVFLGSGRQALGEHFHIGGLQQLLPG